MATKGIALRIRRHWTRPAVRNILFPPSRPLVSPSGAVVAPHPHYRSAAQPFESSIAATRRFAYSQILTSSSSLNFGKYSNKNGPLAMIAVVILYEKVIPITRTYALLSSDFTLFL
ncbi:MAG: hypothetical protein J7L76_05615 [Spirochaetaceae bacterium]|nr:hypothetical protein [Spirochaetaceae bacterium]